MTQEWFTLGEVRAARLPGWDEQRFRWLAERTDRLPARLCRVRRPKRGDELHQIELEYHISVLPHCDREVLRKIFGPTLEERIYRLGIWRPVRTDHERQAGDAVAIIA